MITSSLAVGLVLLASSPPRAEASWWCTVAIFDDLSSWSVCLPSKRECLITSRTIGSRISCQKTNKVFLLDYDSKIHGRVRRAFGSIEDCDEARDLLQVVPYVRSTGSCHLETKGDRR